MEDSEERGLKTLGDRMEIFHGEIALVEFGFVEFRADDGTDEAPEPACCRIIQTPRCRLNGVGEHDDRRLSRLWTRAGISEILV